MVDVSALKGAVDTRIREWDARLWDSSLSIHAQPELGYCEQHAVSVLCELLAAAGIEPERGTAGLATAFRAMLPGASPSPTIALLAEYDALPVVGHGCGHNLIGTAAVGAAIGLSAVAGQLPGSVLVLGCPAEESAVDGSGGKIRLLKLGAFEGLDAALMVHPGTIDIVSNDGSLASCGMEFVFSGRSAHAAVMPHQGINALEAVLLTFASINALRQHLLPSVRIHGIITEGGTSANVIPERAACRFRVRAEEREYLEEVMEKVRACGEAGARATGSQLEVHILSEVYEELLPSEALAGVVRANMAATGRALLDHLPGNSKASTDLGNVSHVIPAISATLKIAEDNTAFHSPGFAAASASPTGRTMLLDAARVLAWSTIDLLVDPGKLEAAKSEFQERKGTRFS